MASKLTVLFFYSISLFMSCLHAVPEPGVKEMVFDAENQFKSFAKSLFKDAKITISGKISQNTENGDKTTKKHDITLSWYLFRSDCAQYFVQLKDDELPTIVTRLTTDKEFSPTHVHLYNQDFIHFKDGHLKKTVITLEKPITTTQPPEEDSSKKNSPDAKPSDKKSPNTKLPKNNAPKEKPPNSKPVPHLPNEKPSHEETPKNTMSSPANRKTVSSSQGHQRKKRAAPENPPQKKQIPPKEKQNPPKEKPNPSKEKQNPPNEKQNPPKEKQNPPKQNAVVAAQPTKGPPKTAGIDGNYLLVIRVAGDLPKDLTVEVKVSMKMSTGYLSAAEWPLLPFYGAMSLVYLAYGVVWLIVSACQWRELLRIQFWIGGVIALGMLEKAILFSEYNNVNDTGIPAHGLVVLALVLSCIKRTLSRILIIIVSMGFGIVKPRLGAALHRVLGVGCLYFILSVIDGSYRDFSVKADVNRKQVIASVPLSVLDAVICWWIFMSLLQTMRTLRIRKNLVKLSLYRHFTNILVVSVITSVAFMIWAIKTHSFNNCIKDLKELWIDDAFWHFLFALILLAIMVLWRPTANNQRYAFTPLIDVGEDDDDEMTLSDAFQGMKNRNKGDVEAPSRAEKQRKKVEDDLKWVEENIPTSGGIDTTLPSLLDSDEEMMTTKLEMNKME